MSSVQSLRRWRLRRSCFLIQSPRITTLFQVRDGVISDGKSLLFGQPVLQAAYDLAGALQGERDYVPKDFSSFNDGLEHIWNERASRYILYAVLQGGRLGPKGCSNVRTFYRESDLGRARRAVPADDGGSAAQSPSTLQHMPD